MQLITNCPTNFVEAGSRVFIYVSRQAAARNVQLRSRINISILRKSQCIVGA